MKKFLFTLLLLLTVFITATTAYAVETETLITLSSESDTLGTSVAYSFDGEYITLNGTYTEFDLYSQKYITQYDASYTSGNLYKVVLTHTSGSMSGTGELPVFMMGVNEQAYTTTVMTNNDVFTRYVTAASSGIYLKVRLPEGSLSGEFVNYTVQLQVYEITGDIVESTANYYDGATLLFSETTIDKLITEPTEPTKENYIFDGWYTTSTFEEEYRFNVILEEDINLYAKWISESTINFYDGATLLSSDLTTNLLIAEPVDPTKSFYIFDGWYTSLAFDEVFDFNVTHDSDTNIYAKWLFDDPNEITLNTTLGGATAEFTISNYGSEAYITNTVGSYNIDYTKLSTDSANKTLITITSGKTYYDTLVIEPNQSILEKITLPDLPGSYVLEIYYSEVSSYVHIDGVGFIWSIPSNDDLKIYLTSSTEFESEYVAVTYEFMSETDTLYKLPGEFADHRSISGEAYSIEGWYLDSSFTTEYNFATLLTTDITLYAKYVDNETGDVLNTQEDLDNAGVDPVDETPDDTTDDTDDTSDEELGAFLQFIQDYWIGILILVIAVALLASKKR